MGLTDGLDVLENVNKQVLRMVMGAWECLGIITCNVILGTELYISATG